MQAFLVVHHLHKFFGMDIHFISIKPKEMKDHKPIVALEQPDQTKRATLAQKLEMIYLLRTYEDNFQEIK